MRQNFKIPSGKFEIVGTLFRPEKHYETLPIVILGAGWKNTLENNFEFAEEVANGIPAAVVVFDYAGIGSSHGNLEHISRKQHLEDFIAVYDWAIQLKGNDKNKVGINGGSYSGYMAILLTAERQVTSLLLRAPVVFPDSTIDEPNNTDAPRPDNYFENIINEKTSPRLSKALNSYTGPLLVQEREGDKLITKPVIDYYLTENNSKKLKHTILKGAGHKISGELKSKSTRECIDWFKQTL